MTNLINISYNNTTYLQNILILIILFLISIIDNFNNKLVKVFQSKSIVLLFLILTIQISNYNKILGLFFSGLILIAYNKNFINNESESK